MKARIKEEHRNRYVIATDNGDFSATVRGKLHLKHSLGDAIPKVGDYIIYEMADSENAVITEILPRGNSFVRKSAHDGLPQTIVANVDLGVIVQGLDGDFNIRRLERYLALVEQSGARPVIVLNKCDVIEEIEPFLNEVKKVAKEGEIFVISAKNNVGMEDFEKIFVKGETSVFIGSSGAGKSTITNYLLNHSAQETKEVREDDSRGRHTTTSRQLFTLPNGAFIIDTPGMRELALVDYKDVEVDIFNEIEALISKCKFNNCDHEKSAGCAISEAIKSEQLDKKRFESYLKLNREAEHKRSSIDLEGIRIQKSKQKLLAKKIKKFKDFKKNEGRS